MTENKDKITFIATGGTIDSVFDAPTERKVIKNDSSIPCYIKKTIAPHFDIEPKKVSMIDSLDMVDKHRQEVLSAIEQTGNEKIIITHGTDTMLETALFLENNLTDNNKIIVLVGSMIPLDGFYQSDAPFNLGYAIAQVQLRNAGIYICMNAQCFSTKEVIKNKKIGRFEFKDDS